MVLAAPVLPPPTSQPTEGRSFLDTSGSEISIQEEEIAMVLGKMSMEGGSVETKPEPTDAHVQDASALPAMEDRNGERGKETRVCRVDEQRRSGVGTSGSIASPMCCSTGPRCVGKRVQPGEGERTATLRKSLETRKCEAYTILLTKF